nr:hypothetical protein [Tanacetum cinerariifolium]
MLVAHEVKEGDADENVEDVNAGDAVEEDVKAGDAAEGDVSAAHDEVPTANEEPFHLLHHLLHHHNHLKLSLPLTKVEHMELDKIAQALKITKLNQRVKKPVRRNKGRMIADMDADADVVLEEAKDVAVDAKADQDADIQEEESEQTKFQEVVDIVSIAKIITEVVTVASTTITTADVSIPVATTAAAPTLIAAPSGRTKGVLIRDLEESTTTTSKIIHSEAKSKDKGKGILVEEPKPLKKQAQI